MLEKVELPADDDAGDMRTRIRNVAARLLVQHGYPGLRFGDIADELGTTRANVHYHFGTKPRLVEFVIEEHMKGVLATYERIWLNAENSYAEKIEQMCSFHRQLFETYNGPGDGRNNWSVVDRLRNDAKLLSPRAAEALRTHQRIETMIAAAVQLAQHRGEISKNVAIDDVIVQATSIIDFAPSMTQSTGSLDRLEAVYRAHINVVCRPDQSRAAMQRAS